MIPAPAPDAGRMDVDAGDVATLAHDAGSERGPGPAPRDAGSPITADTVHLPGLALTAIVPSGARVIERAAAPHLEVLAADCDVHVSKIEGPTEGDYGLALEMATSIMQVPLEKLHRNERRPDGTYVIAYASTVHSESSTGETWGLLSRMVVGSRGFYCGGRGVEPVAFQCIQDVCDSLADAPVEPDAGEESAE